MVWHTASYGNDSSTVLDNFFAHVLQYYNMHNRSKNSFCKKIIISYYFNGNFVKKIFEVKTYIQ